MFGSASSPGVVQLAADFIFGVMNDPEREEKINVR